MKNRLILFLITELALCIALLAVWNRFEIDDGYIFLSYAKNLAASGLFAFNPGEPSYGFSSPAYVVLLAVASRLSGIAVGVALSNILGVIMCGLAAVAAWSLWGEIGEQPSHRGIILASLLFSGPWFFTAWFIYGMETGLAVLSVFGFLLWLIKLRAGAPRFPWLLIGVLAASVLSVTRLESGLYIGFGILVALFTSKTKKEWIDLAVVSVLAGSAELAWLLYAKHLFGTYMPWTSTARLIYYLPSGFPKISGYQYYHLGIPGRLLLALKAIFHMTFGGPLRFLLVSVPLIATVFFLRMQEKPAHLKRVLLIAALGMTFETLTFSFLFPLAQNRHLMPYIAGIWVLIAPMIAGSVSRMGRTMQATALTLVVLLWIGGAALFRRNGMDLEPLHLLARSGNLLPQDKVAAEPIGIISFETKSHIIDLGGLTDRDAWPMLMQVKPKVFDDVIHWDIGKGANKLLLSIDECGPKGLHYGNYCLVDSTQASTLLYSR